MHIQADVVSSGKLRLARMQAHAHSHGYTLGPKMGSKGTLGVYGGFEGIGGARKSHEEAIPLRIHLVAVPPLEACSQQALAPGEDTGVALAQLLQQACGAFDVAEEHRHGSCWQVWHEGPPCIKSEYVHFHSIL